MEGIIENDHPVNQLALKKLHQVKEGADPNLLYVLQLANWAVQENKVRVHRHGLLQNLDLLLFQWKPEDSLHFLDLDHERPADPNLSPLQLAVWVLDLLDSALVEQVTSYRPIRTNQPVNVL